MTSPVIKKELDTIAARAKERAALDGLTGNTADYVRVLEAHVLAVAMDHLPTPADEGVLRALRREAEQRLIRWEARRRWWRPGALLIVWWARASLARLDRAFHEAAATKDSNALWVKTKTAVVVELYHYHKGFALQADALRATPPEPSDFTNEEMSNVSQIG